MKVVSASFLAVLLGCALPWTASASCGAVAYGFVSTALPQEFNIVCPGAPGAGLPDFDIRFWEFRKSSIINNGTIVKIGGSGWLSCGAGLTRFSTFANWGPGNGTVGCPCEAPEAACDPTTDAMLFLATNTTAPTTAPLSLGLFTTEFALVDHFSPEHVVNAAGEMRRFNGDGTVTTIEPETQVSPVILGAPLVSFVGIFGGNYRISITYTRPVTFGPLDAEFGGEYNIASVILFFRNDTVTPTNHVRTGQWTPARGVGDVANMGRVVRDAANSNLIANTFIAEIPIPGPGTFQYMALSTQVDGSGGDYGLVADTDGFLPDRVGQISPQRLAPLAAPSSFLSFTSTRPPGTSPTMDLTWQVGDNSGITFFDIYRAERAGQPMVKLNGAPIPSTAVGYLDANCPRGPRYVYEIRAMGAAGTLATAKADGR